MIEILAEMPTLEDLLKEAHRAYMAGEVDESMYFENQNLNIRLNFSHIVKLWEILGLVRRQ